jgi:hypothetical protein
MAMVPWRVLELGVFGSGRSQDVISVSRFMLRLALYGGTDWNLGCPTAMPDQNEKCCEADELSWKLEYFFNCTLLQQLLIYQHSVRVQCMKFVVA